MCKLMIQSDFDGTLTEGDMALITLDYFTDKKWRYLYDDYCNGKLGLDEFNSKAFGYVTASEQEFKNYSYEQMVIKPGCKELIETCRRKGIRFHIVSNGIVTYIDAFIEKLGIGEIEYAAAKALYDPSGMKSWYENPDGERVLNGFKDSYTQRFKEQGYKIIYLGDGTSDFNASRMCDKVFACDDLEQVYIKNNLPYTKMAGLETVTEYINSIC